MKSVGMALLFPFLLTPIVSFLFRMVNATIAPELVAEFNLGPAELGLITSAYFIGFGLTQLPMGVLLDRYGPRVVVIALQLVGALGGALFSRQRCCDMPLSLPLTTPSGLPSARGPFRS